MNKLRQTDGYVMAAPAYRGARVGAMILLVLAGETIFALPFHVARFFRPTLLLVLDLSNTELGIMQSAYGLVALLSYFPGGMLADRFEVSQLLSVSLLSTALGGLYFATLPSYWGMFLLHLYFGATTILLFWSAMIRATRKWGGFDGQGRAFGVLDGGRGLLAALLATLGLSILSTGQGEVFSKAARTETLQNIIYFYTAFTALLGVGCWWGLRGYAAQQSDSFSQDNCRHNPPSFRRGLQLLQNRQLIVHSLVIVAAYCAYKGIDFYSIWAVQSFGLSELEGAQLVVASVWLRPLSAFCAGLLADKFGATKMSFGAFALLMGLYLLMSCAPTGADSLGILFSSVAMTSILVYAFRALYFAMIGQGGVPQSVTGTAVGIVSFIGFTPDFFFPAISGWVVDRGAVGGGYQVFFLILALWMLLGALAAVLLLRRARSRPRTW